MIFQPYNTIQVTLNFNENPILVGRIASKNRLFWFEYDAEFIAKGYSISPFKLPLHAGAVPCHDRCFEGLFGVFNDSLPDGWGRLLLDRQLNQYSISPEKLTPLDRLAYVGHYGMGALCYEPAIEQHALTQHILKLDEIAQESKLVLENDSETFFEELLALNGSSSGARPKIVACVSDDKKRIVCGYDILPKKYTHWIIKFHASLDPKDIGAIEFAYSNMARHAGIDVPETFLFPSQSGPGYFGAQRFDRHQNQRIHMHTLSGLLHADYRLPNLDYESFLKATYLLTQSMIEVEKAYYLAVFNVLAHNRDDHSKNFSFLMNEKGQWRLAPAYDLTFSSGPAGEQSMTVMGEGKSPGIPHLLKLAERFSIQHSKEIIDKVRASLSQWRIFSDEANVTRTSKEKIQRAIQII